MCLGQTPKIKHFVQVRAVLPSRIACIIVGQAEKGVGPFLETRTVFGETASYEIRAHAEACCTLFNNEFR